MRDKSSGIYVIGGFRPPRQLKLRHYVLCLLIFLLVFFRPHSQAFGPILSVYLADVFIVFVLFFNTYRLSELIYHLGLSSGLYALAVVGLSSDLAFIASMWLYFYAFSRFMARNSDFCLSEKFFRCVVFLSSAITILQLFDVYLLSSFVEGYWGDIKLRGLDSGSTTRVFGSFYNANWAAVCYSAMFHYFIEKLSQGFQPLRFTLLCCLFVMIVMTGSKTGVALIVVVLVSRLLRSGIVGRSGLTVLCVFLPLLVIWISTTENKRFSLLKNMSLEQLGAESLDGRITTWDIYIDGFIGAPIFGNADLASGIAHNSYLFILGSAGLFGSLLFILQWRGILSDGVRRYHGVSGGAKITVLLLAIAALSGEYFFSTQVVLVYLCVFWALATERAGPTDWTVSGRV